MTIEDFEDDFKNGKIPECFDHVLIDGILTDEVIYEMASELQNEKLNVISLVCLISYFLEKSKNQLKESALRLSIMALRANNEGFNVEFFSNDIMQKFHQTLPMLPRYLQDDVVKLIAAFCNTKSYANFKYLHDLCKILKVEGYKFPKKAIKFDNSNSPPTWISDGNLCHLCRNSFTTLNRKHHCRNCGNLCCSKCSSNHIQLPHYFIFKPTRVCDVCRDSFTTNKRKRSIFDIACTYIFINISPEQCKSQNQTNKKKDEDKTESDPDLKRAIELSLKDNQSMNKNPIPIQFRPLPALPISNQIKDIENSKNLSFYPKLEAIDDDCDYESLKDQSPILPPIQTKPQPDQIEIIESPFNNLVVMIERLEDKINFTQKNPKEAYANHFLQALFQASLGVYSAFETSRENNFREIQKFDKYIDTLNRIEKARSTLNQSRKSHFLMMQQQKQESDVFLRIQMEQKMRLMQEQQMAFEEYKKSLTEQRLKQFEACPQPDSSLGASAYPQYNARLSEPTQSIHDASLSQFNANLFPSVPQQPFYEQKDAFDSQSMISDVLIQAPPLNLMPTNIPSSTQGRNDNTPNQNSPSTIDELILFDPKLD